MAKREAGLKAHKKSKHSPKTKKRLAAKREMQSKLKGKKRIKKYRK